jgi:hypothetical protein
MYNIIILVIIVLIGIWIYRKQEIENFELPGEYVGPKPNIEIDKYGKPIAVTYMQPTQLGKHGCTIVPCPKNYSNNLVCWSCCNYD